MFIKAETSHESRPDAVSHTPNFADEPGKSAKRRTRANEVLLEELHLFLGALSVKCSGFQIIWSAFERKQAMEAVQILNISCNLIRAVFFAVHAHTAGFLGVGPGGSREGSYSSYHGVMFQTDGLPELVAMTSDDKTALLIEQRACLSELSGCNTLLGQRFSVRGERT